MEKVLLRKHHSFRNHLYEVSRVPHTIDGNPADGIDDADKALLIDELRKDDEDAATWVIRYEEDGIILASEEIEWNPNEDAYNEWLDIYG